MKKIARMFGSSKYNNDELVIIKKVQECFTQTISPDIPKELQLSQDGESPFHTISPTDLIKSFWVKRLKKSLLRPETGEMIGDITDYIAERSTLNFCRANDPWNLTCYEFLNWLARDLSGAECNKDTLIMVQNRCQYIIQLRDSKAFVTKDDQKSTMLNVLTSILGTLQTRVIPIISKEIANHHVRHHIATLRIHGELLLNYGFQFLYYVLRKTKELPSPNITELPQNVLNTRSGQLLHVLIKTPPYCKVLELGKPSQAITSNPFMNSDNQPCIPSELLTEPPSCTEISHYLDKNARGFKIKKTGILSDFRSDHELLINFVKLHAFLVEFGRALISCYDAYNAAGKGGDLLVYGQSQKVIVGLMESMKKLCATLNELHDEINKKAMSQRGIIGKKKLGSRKLSDKRWDENYDNLFSVNLQFKEAIDLCTAQAETVKVEAEKITIDTRIKKALAQTLHFSETTTLLCAHIDSVLNNRPHRLDQRSASAIGISPRSMPSTRLGLLAESPRSSRALSISPPSMRLTQGEVFGETSSTPGSPILVKPRRETLGSRSSLTALTTPDYMTDPLDLSEIRCAPHSISDNSIRFLLGLLEDPTGLRTFIMSSQSLTGKGAILLWEALSKNHDWEKIVISNIPKIFSAPYIKNGNDDPHNLEVVAKFADILPEQSNLTFLSLAGCNINPLVINIIVNRLSQIPRLEVIDLSDNPLTDEGLNIVCTALAEKDYVNGGLTESCPSITELRIVNCGITETGATHLLKLLQTKTTITNVLIMAPGAFEERSLQTNKSAYANKFSAEIIGKIAAQIDLNIQTSNPTFEKLGM